MRRFAEWLGWLVMAAGGIALTASFLALAMDYAWGKIKLLRDLRWLQRACSAYQKIEPKKDGD